MTTTTCKRCEKRVPPEHKEGHALGHRNLDLSSYAWMMRELLVDSYALVEGLQRGAEADGIRVSTDPSLAPLNDLGNAIARLLRMTAEEEEA